MKAHLNRFRGKAQPPPPPKPAPPPQNPLARNGNPPQPPLQQLPKQPAPPPARLGAVRDGMEGFLLVKQRGKRSHTWQRRFVAMRFSGEKLLVFEATDADGSKQTHRHHGSVDDMIHAARAQAHRNHQA